MRTVKKAPRGRFKEGFARVLFLLAACVSILAVILICVFLLANGIPAIREVGLFKFLSGKVWRPGNDIYGILPMIVGSLYITAGAILFGVPTGILTALYLSRFASRPAAKILNPAVELLAGIPSVVYGFFGLVVIVPVLGSSILTASLLLGIMILPTIITVAKSSLDAVPQPYYEGALALGATHERSVCKILFPAARSGVLAGVVLGIGRAIGETMAVMMVAGNQPRITGNLLKGIRTLTTNIVLEMGYATDLHREVLIATALVLFVFILLLNLSFSALKRRSESV